MQQKTFKTTFINLIKIPYLIAIFLFIPNTASAFNIQDAFFSSHSEATTFKEGTIGSIVSLLLPNIIIVAGLIFFFLILYGGFSLVVYAGKNNSPQQVEKGKNSITYGLIGLLLVIAAYFILQIISTITGIDLMTV